MSAHDKKVEGMKRNLEEKTGRSLEAWRAALEAEDLPDRKAKTAWLKAHRLGHFQRRLILSDA